MTSDPMETDDGAALSLYRRLFEALERDGIDYCVWKNLNELADALSGHGDIDLHVRPRSRAAFLETLRAHRFVRVETHKSHPWIAHYYGFDPPSGSLCHLHCYFRLVTGESHIKQYVVPLERHLAALPDARNALGVREMHPWLQARVHRFRRRIKLSCLPGALLFLRERHGYAAEQALLERDEAAPANAAALGGWPATIVDSGGPWNEIVRGFAYRHRFRSWSRFSPFTAPLARYGSLPRRAVGKLRRWRKTLPLGLLVMIEGGDGRADALRREIDDWLGGDLRLHTFRLPDTDGDTGPRGLLSRCRRRRSVLRAAVRAAAEGSVAICYGWDPSRLRRALSDSADAAGTSGPVRRALARSVARLDEAAEADIVLRTGTAVVADDELRGAVVVGVDDTAAERWRERLWQALVARQL